MWILLAFLFAIFLGLGIAFLARVCDGESTRAETILWPICIILSLFFEVKLMRVAYFRPLIFLAGFSAVQLGLFFWGLARARVQFTGILAILLAWIGYLIS